MLNKLRAFAFLILMLIQSGPLVHSFNIYRVQYILVADQFRTQKMN